ncbi:MAG: FAD-linked oxidase C-terminal domain-containing protein [Peptococcaceae bacterium]|nr:FAD-linked oxidase C-terminal domain-containing protein [Peptococcaceae bacterium]
MLENKEAHLHALREIFGKERVLHEPVDCFGYSYDASPEALNPDETPDFVCKAHSTEEVSALMNYANTHKIPVVCRGTGSGRSGGVIPVRGGIVLMVDEMNKIVELDEKNLTLRVQPGVLTKEIHDFCADHNLYYPPEPSSYKYSTIGGNIAENAGGIRAVKYGVTSDYVLGLEVVLANGDVIHTGGKLIKNVTGYNMTQLFVGSEGTLGIITEATLKVIGRPKFVKSAMATFRSIEDACTAVGDCLISGVTPTAAELMDKLSCEATAKFNDFPIGDDVGAMLVFDLDGNTADICESDMATLEAVCRKDGALDFTHAKDDAERDHLWSLRNKLSTALKSLAPDRVGEDITVPRAELPAICTKIVDIATRYGFKVSIFGHAGDGNLHPSLLCDMSQPGVPEKVHDCVGEIFQAAVDCGGMLSGEHGIGISKQPYIDIALEKEEIDASLLIKKALDPNNILNPGKIFNR